MKKKKILLFLLMFTCLGLYAQKEAYNWPFGDKAGLTWKTKRQHTDVTRLYGNTYSTSLWLPATFANNVRTYEGCFALSDENTGDIMFYSDGRTIYDRTGGVMTNGSGLSGHPSSTQSGVLMPYPGAKNANKYIALTVPQVGGVISYSVIDMSEGNGKVLADEKNIKLTGGRGRIGESMSVIQHANKKDFWIVAPGSGTTTALNAWLVTKDGVQTSVYEVTTGIPIADNNYNSGSFNRTFKFSPNGQHFVWTLGSGVVNGSFMIGDFDTKTGKFSNVKIVKFDEDGTMRSTYGAEFSSSGKYLYIIGNMSMKAYIFASLKTSPTTYSPTTYKLAGTDSSSNALFPASLQLGPDGYMYGTYYDFNNQPQDPIPTTMQGTRRHMFLITNPEYPMQLNVYLLNNFLAPNTGGHLGLPSFSPSWFATDVEGPTEVCVGQTNTYTFRIGGSLSNRPSELHWYFKDKDNTTYFSQTVPYDASINSLTFEYAYETAGAKQIEIRAYDSSSVPQVQDIVTLDVNVYDSPTLSVNGNTVCAGESAALTANVSAGTTVNWYANLTDVDPLHTGTAFATPKLTKAGTATYYVEAINAAGCGGVRQAVQVTVLACGTQHIPVNPHLRSFYKNK